jgi:hypothetical protein
MKNRRMSVPRKQPPSQPIGHVDASGKRHIGLEAVKAFHADSERASLLVTGAAVEVPAGCTVVTPGQSIEGKADMIFLEGPKALYCVDDASAKWFNHVLMPASGHKATIIGKLEVA